MIATIAVIAAIAEKKKRSQRSVYSDHMKPLSSDRSDNNRWRSLSLRSLESGSHMIAELFFSAIAAITAIVAIIFTFPFLFFTF